MINRLFLLSTVVSLAFAGFSAAQQTDATEDAAEAPATEAAEATPAPAVPVTKETAEVGQVYTTQSGDWTVECEKTVSSEDPCLMVQVLRDENEVAIMEAEVTRVASENNIGAVMLIRTPLLTLLTEGVTFRIDGGDAARIPFFFCDANVCVARVNLRDQDANAFKRGNAAELRIVPVAAPERSVIVKMSLSGFTAAYDGLPTLGGQ